MTEGEIAAGLRLQEILIDLEFLMRDGGMWQDDRPADWAFASELPFFYDRMSFPEWLQFVFLPNLHSIAQNDIAWPDDCAVAPMADHYFASQGISATRLIMSLQLIDQLISTHTCSGEMTSATQTE